MRTLRRSTQTPVRVVKSRFSAAVPPPSSEPPAYIRKTSAGLSAAGTSITASFPTPTPVNRLLVAMVTSANTLAGAWITPSGWSRGPEVAVSGLLGTVIFYTIAIGDGFVDGFSDSFGGGSEPLSYTFGTGTTSSFKLLTILEFSGNLTASVFDKQASAADAGVSVTSIGTGTTAALAQVDEISVAIASVSGLSQVIAGYDDDYSDDYAAYADTNASPNDLYDDIFGDIYEATEVLTSVYQPTYPATYTAQGGSGAPTWNLWTNSYQSVSVQSAGDSTLTSHNVAYRILSSADAQSSSVSWSPALRAVAAVATFKTGVSTTRSGSTTVTGRGRLTLSGTRAGGLSGSVSVSESGSIQGTGMAVSSTVIQASPVATVLSGSSVRGTWPQATTPGNLLLAFVVATPNSGFAGSSGWVALNQAVQAGLAGQVFYIPNAGSRSGDETFTFGSISAGSLMLMEVRGVIAASPLDVQATSSGTSSLAATGQSAETAQDNEFWIGLVGVNGTTTFDGESNGFNLFRTSTGTRVSMAVLDAPVASQGLASTSVALQSSLPWVGAVATFKASPLDLGGETFAGSASMTMGASGNGVLKAQGSGRADIVISARGGANVTAPPPPGSPPVIPPPDAYDVVRKETEELAILLTEPRVTYDFDSVRNTVEVLGALPEAGLKRVRAVAIAPRNHPLSPHNLARNGEPRYLVEVIETGLSVHRRVMPGWADNKLQIKRWRHRESDRIHGAMVKRKKRAQEIANRRLDEFLRLSVEVETDCLPQPHLELGDLVLLKSKTAGRFEFRYKRGSLPLGSSSGMSIGFNKRLRILKKKRKKTGGGGRGNNGRSAGVGNQSFGWPDPR